MGPEEYRRLQIASVTGHTGSNELEILLITLWIPVATLFYSSVLSPFFEGRHQQTKFLVQFFTFCTPQVLLFSYPSYALPTLLITIAASLAALRKRRGVKQVRHDVYDKNVAKLTFITNSRAAITIMVTIAILAVDFNVFPRRLAKTQTYGSSLMDVGVGCVVSSFGLVAARHYGGGRSTSLLGTMKSTLPLLILGLLRTLFVKGVNYQEHVAEYGVHWNFFITLGLLPILFKISLDIFPPSLASQLGLSVGILYQIALNSTGLVDYLAGDDRTDLISMNKEGLFSLIGYHSLALMSLGVGLRVMSYGKDPAVTKPGLAKFLAIRIISLSILFASCRFLGVPVSRRMCNLPFIAWTLGKTLVLVLSMLLIDMVEPQPSPVLLEAISQNQLATFLSANIATGVINMFLYTLLASDFTAHVILQAYSLFVFSFAYWLFSHQVLSRPQK